MAPTKWAGPTCCFAMAVILPIVLISVGEIVLPQMITTRLHDAIVKDTQRKVDDWTKDAAIFGSAEFIFFNLTNALELQTVTPAPKPHFERISYTARYEGNYFGGETTSEGNQFKYSEWSHYVPTDPSDLDKEIVQVNPVYLSALYALGAPSEKLLFVSLSHQILSRVNRALTGFGASLTAAPNYPTTVGSAEMILKLTGQLESNDQCGADLCGADLGAAQFGTNIFMNLAVGITDQTAQVSVAMNPAMKSLGVCTPIELNTYMNDVDAGPFMPGGQLSSSLAARGVEFVGFQMTVDQASTFLATFTKAEATEIGKSSSYIAVLGSLVQTYLAALNSDDATSAAGAETQMNTLFSSTFGTIRVKLLTNPEPGSGSGSEAAVESGRRLSEEVSAEELRRLSEAGGGGIGRGDSVFDLPPSAIISIAYASYLTTYLPESFFVGCNLVGSGPLRADGTGTTNAGLFTRQTIGGILNGWDDPLISVASTLALPPGVSLPAAYTGVLGPFRNETNTVEDLVAAIAAGTADRGDYEYEAFSGKDDVVNNRKFVSFLGYSVLNETNADYFGWGNDGTPGATLAFAGLRDQAAQSPRKDPLSSWAMYTDGFEAKPDFGAGIPIFFASGRMPVIIGCKSNGTWGDNNTDDCALHDIKGIKTLKYTMPHDLPITKVNGKKSATCAGTASAHFVESMAAAGLPTIDTASTCDFIMRGNGLFSQEKIRKIEPGQGSLAPRVLTLGYLHHVDQAMRDAVSITDSTSSTLEIYFVEEEDDVALYIDPITGRTLKGNENTQINFMIEEKMLNSNRYTNLFSASDSFVWPYIYLKRVTLVKDDDADNYKRRIHGGFTIGFALIIAGSVLCVLCTLLGIFSCIMATGFVAIMHTKSKAGNSKDAESKPDALHPEV